MNTTITASTVSPRERAAKSQKFVPAAATFLSPSCDSSPPTPYVATPLDDKSKDPDWGPTQDDVDWAKTPLGQRYKTRRSNTKNVLI